MGSINKTSVREADNKNKAEFEKLRSAGKINPECLTLMKSQFELIDIILAVFLEKETKKNSKNSSKPPSQTNKDESALNQIGSKGKGKAEANNTVNNTRVTESVTLSEVVKCDVCGEDLSNTPSHKCERRTKIDIIFEKVVEHVDAEIKLCPACESTSKGDFPSDMKGPLQYGKGLKAYIISLLVCQMISLNRCQKMIKAMIGSIISQASMLKFILKLYLALAGWEASATADLLNHPAINTDETSLRVDKKNHWIHVYSAGDITLKFLHRKRGMQAINDINIIPRYGGTIIHDCWASYLSQTHCTHGLCGSHLLRELTFIVESNGYAWAANMKRLLKDACQAEKTDKDSLCQLAETLQKHPHTCWKRAARHTAKTRRKARGYG